MQDTNAYMRPWRRGSRKTKCGQKIATIGRDGMCGVGNLTYQGKLCEVYLCRKATVSCSPPTHFEPYPTVLEKGCHNSFKRFHPLHMSWIHDSTNGITKVGCPKEPNALLWLLRMSALGEVLYACKPDEPVQQL
jgi:hypothetical protein